MKTPEEFFDTVALILLIITTFAGAIYMSLHTTFEGIGIGVGIIMIGIFLRALSTVLIEISNSLKSIKTKL